MTSKHPGKVDWILASASPRRRRILEELGLDFRVEPSFLPEPDLITDERPETYAGRVARMKAHAIGADTIVVSGSLILGKPASEKDAAGMIRSLSGRWHEVMTGVCLLDCGAGKTRSACERSRVHFRRLSAAEVDWYIGTGEYRDKAGAYAIQGYASIFIDRLEGCYFNVVGFPLARFERLCRSSGISLRDQLKRPEDGSRPVR
jgi:septum formation protein